MSGTGWTGHLPGGSVAPVCPDGVTRLAGPTRVETAVEISRWTFPTRLGGSGLASDPAPVLVNAGAYADALVGGPLTRGRAPLLLTTTDTLHPATAAELDRLDPARVIVVGDATAVGNGVVAELTARGIAVDRIEGTDRFATAAMAAARMPGALTLLTRGSGPDGWPDALAAGPWAARDGHPVLLTATDTLPEATAGAIADRGRPVVIVGGVAAVSSQVEDAVRALGVEVSRVAGSDRYATAAAVLATAWPADGPGARSIHGYWVATGTNWPDALAVGPAAAAADRPVILSPATGLRDAPSAAALVYGRGYGQMAVLAGGPDVLSPAVAAAVGLGAAPP